ncbi:Serine hydrolase FSH [Parasponia andersonii]|uniref:Serine hydrolase FSH n=1 Tax=Parasponia andersonii TaxID=3476 RepID=A0A2P5D8R1_PARAD|nr:Serine hydrolase FSH [Parasponia andersonii]
MQLEDDDELSPVEPNKRPENEEEEDGILLYYKYTQIPDVEELLAFYSSNCNSLHLLGRVRLSPLGVNVTVGGKLCSLKKHIAAVESNPLFHGTDFKLATCPPPSNNRVAQECGFTSLSIRIVKDLVTLHSNPMLKPPEISDAGKHLSALEFHSLLQNAGQSLDNESPTQNKQLVLLDARNVYETRIGKFHAPNVETLDPGIRQYSDLPLWIDDNSDCLRGKCVLMYCTGGIRCEMASAYLRSKGAGFENVFQPSGIEPHLGCTSPSPLEGSPPPLHCKKKFAWLVAPNFSQSSETHWKIADCPFDALQYQQQTDGFDASLAYLRDVYAQQGPFDGILGFSQGAAMAAAVCAKLGMQKGEMEFRFAILCSGFALKFPELLNGELIKWPSLHIFGSDHGKDRQIANQASRELASLFDDGCSVTIQHDSGHIIPTRSPYIDQIKYFLQRFL